MDAQFEYKKGEKSSVYHCNHCKHAELPEYIQKLKVLLHHKLVERWGRESKVAHLYPVYLASTFLDHKYRNNKDLALFKDTAFFFINNMALDMMKKEAAAAAAAAAAQPRRAEERVPNASAAPPATSFGSGKAGLKLTAAQIAHLESMADEEEAFAAAGRTEGDRLSEEEMKTKVLDEIDRLKKEKVDFDSIGSVSSIDWWKSYRGSFPILCRLARSLLSIPASSASCERVFSQAGLTLSKLRTRLGVDTMANLMMIKYHHGEDKVYLTLKDWEEVCERLTDEKREEGQN